MQRSTAIIEMNLIDETFADISQKNGNKESVQGGHTNLFNILRRNSINNMNRD